MKKSYYSILSIAGFLFCLVLASLCQAAPKSVVILPFAAQTPQNLSYLSKAVPAAVQGKLNQSGVAAHMGQKAAMTAAEARKAMGKADYAVWGTVAVQGNTAIIGFNSVDRSGKNWSKTTKAPLNGMNAAIQAMTQDMARESMGLSLQAGSQGMMTPGSRAKNPTPLQGSGASSDIIVNDTGQQYYLNPQFRYQGASAGDSTRLRSQRLKLNMTDMAVADFNGDGRNEVAILDAHHLTMFVWGNDGKLKELGSTLISQTNQNFSMRAIDLNRDGAMEIVIATFDEEQNRPYTFFYSFKGNRFSQFADKCAYFCSVVRLPPTYQPTLVGQGWDSLKLFAPGVHTMVKSGNKFALGARLNLPKEANAFNICWLPNSRGGDGEKLIVLRDDERIKIYSGRNTSSAIHTTMERYSGSAIGMEHYKGMPGLGVDKNYQLPSKYYAPMRFITADLGHTGEYVLMMNKPISTASQFFDRYRFFPQGEIHALYWDGVGLGLKWKTRRIRGSVAEIDLADMNNDGILDLVVGINSSPDLGVGGRQCMITAYPLNTNATDPNAPVDMSDFEVSPNR
ncbi:MAG: VCBS repeat-containing protein [Desulfovibrio sp.]|nr:VCBS repeat-containing protein [Desulfovibrio sp.]